MKKIILLSFALLSIGLNAQNIWLNSAKYTIRKGTVWQKEYTQCSVDICITRYENVQNSLRFYDNVAQKIIYIWNIKSLKMSKNNGITTYTMSCVNESNESIKIVLTQTKTDYKKIRLIYLDSEEVYIIDHVD
jgi:hypothetical protein